MAVDIGGTFTDLIGFDEELGTLHHAKQLTTYGNLAHGVLGCVEKSGLPLGGVSRLIHGSTIAINTVIERKGANVALIVTKGTRDVYAIGRGNRVAAFDLRFKRSQPLMPRRAIYEIDERMLADGSVLRPLDQDNLRSIAGTIRDRGYDAVAVCLLHSYRNPAHEQQVRELLVRELPDVYVSVSHEIMREYREYERTSTTVVNSYIGPRVGGYVASLRRELTEKDFRGELSIMQSNGGVMAPELAARRPVMMMESGPVGGVIAGARIAEALGYRNIISFDMGGTTAKASLVQDASPKMADGYYVGGYESGDPIMAPVVDIVEVGTGGGSIARIDEYGSLKVGPMSAGSTPGPICYGLGGSQPTITDANVVLGRIGASDFLGGDMRLDEASAKAGIEAQIGAPLGFDADQAALAIVDIAIASMSLSVREVSVEQGHDPRDFALVASGGAGPLHALAVARDLQIPTVIIPPFPSHFSALGMLLAQERHDLVRTYLARLDNVDLEELQALCAELEAEADAIARQKGAPSSLLFELRYVGQEFSIAVPVERAQLAAGALGEVRRAFDALHEKQFAHHAADEPVELVNVRLVLRGDAPSLALPAVRGRQDAEPARRRVVFANGAHDCRVYQRDQLVEGKTYTGPMLIQEYGTTTVLHPGDVARVAAHGALIVEVSAS